MLYVLLCPSVRSILGASHLLDKSTQQGGEDPRRFSSQSHAQDHVQDPPVNSGIRAVEAAPGQSTVSLNSNLQR